MSHCEVQRVLCLPYILGDTIKFLAVIIMYSFLKEMPAGLSSMSKNERIYVQYM
jgi:hypothetical protein